MWLNLGGLNIELIIIAACVLGVAGIVYLIYKAIDKKKNDDK